MKDDYESALSIASADLDTVAELITMRFPLRAAEARRGARMRALMAVTADLNRALSTYAQHALVHCQGTAGTSDLSADTAALTEALRAFSTEIRMIAREYDSINEPIEPFAIDRTDRAPRGRDLMPWQSPHVACPAADSGMAS
jgi:hypothetical protein